MTTAQQSQPAKPVWTWRDAIDQSEAPPLTRLVCLVISHYLSDAGRYCTPTVEELMKRTGLSNTSVATHLKNAVDFGLLRVERRKGSDGRHIRNRYWPQFPADCELSNDAAMHDELDSDESDEVHVKDLHVDKPSQNGSPPREGGSCGEAPVHVNMARSPREYGEFHHVKDIHATNYRKEDLSKGELSKTTTTPPPPPQAGGSANDDEPWRRKPEPRPEPRFTRAQRSRQEVEATIGELREIPGATVMVDGLFEPILRTVPFNAPSPAYAIRTLIDWAIDWGLTSAEIAEIRDKVLGDAGRKRRVYPADIQDAMSAVRKRRPKAGFTASRRNTPAQYDAWLSYAEKRRDDPAMKTIASMLYLHEVWTVPSEWPPVGEIAA